MKRTTLILLVLLLLLPRQTAAPAAADDMRLAAIAENPRAFVSVERRPGLVTPAQRRQMEDAEALRSETARDPFVAGIIQTFDGLLTDVHRLDRQDSEEEQPS